MTSHLPSCLIPPPQFPRQSNTTMTIEGPVHTYNKQPHCSQRAEDPCFSAKCPEKKKRTSSAAIHPTWKGPLERGHGFPHSLQHFETLFCTQYIHQLSKSRERPMPSPKMSHQGLFGCVTPATLSTMKLHLLSMTLKMEVRHNPGSQDCYNLPRNTQYPQSGSSYTS